MTYQSEIISKLNAELTDIGQRRSGRKKLEKETNSERAQNLEAETKVKEYEEEIGKLTEKHGDRPIKPPKRRMPEEEDEARDG